VAALTADVIVDRVRSLCCAPPFEMVEAVTWDSFDLQPAQNANAVFRIMPPSSQRVVGGFDYWEDRTDSMQVWVQLQHKQDHVAARRLALQYVHSLTSAIVRDGTSVSGDYSVPDEGRGHAIVSYPGKDYLALRLTLPINYDSQL
jgi:hypothetical protein